MFSERSVDAMLRNWEAAFVGSMADEDGVMEVFITLEIKCQSEDKAEARKDAEKKAELAGVHFQGKLVKLEWDGLAQEPDDMTEYPY